MSDTESDKTADSRSSVLPFDWTDAGHVVVKAGKAVDWNFNNPSEFIKRVQSIEYGLSAESEFAAILTWLDRCSLVHGLDQDYFSNHSESTWSVPDILAVFENRGARVPVLIEVKTRKGNRLAMKTSELESMQRYSNMLSLPLLFAWKSRQFGFWFLVDPIHFVHKEGKSILTLEAAMMNNLLGTVAGDFLVVPEPIAAFSCDSRSGRDAGDVTPSHGCPDADAAGIPRRSAASDEGPLRLAI